MIKLKRTPYHSTVELPPLSCPLAMAGPCRSADSEQEGYCPSDASVVEDFPRSRSRSTLKCCPLDALLEDRSRRLVSRSMRVQPEASAKTEDFQFDLSTFAKDTDALGSDRQGRRARLTAQALRQRASTDDSKGAAAAAAVPKSPSEDSRRSSGSGRFSRFISQKRRQANFKQKGDINRSISEGRESITESEASSFSLDTPSEQDPFWEDTDFDCEFREWVMEGLDVECEACSTLHLMQQAQNLPRLHELEATCRHSCHQKHSQSRSAAVKERVADVQPPAKEEEDVDGSLTFKLWRPATGATESVTVDVRNDKDEPSVSASKAAGSQRRLSTKDPWAKVELGEDKGLDLEVCDF